jgi:hypothetical protein
MGKEKEASARQILGCPYNSIQLEMACIKCLQPAV